MMWQPGDRIQLAEEFAFPVLQRGDLGTIVAITSYAIFIEWDGMPDRAFLVDTGKLFNLSEQQRAEVAPNARSEGDDAAR